MFVDIIESKSSLLAPEEAIQHSNVKPDVVDDQQSRVSSNKSSGSVEAPVDLSSSSVTAEATKQSIINGTTYNHTSSQSSAQDIKQLSIHVQFQAKSGEFLEALPVDLSSSFVAAEDTLNQSNITDQQMLVSSNKSDGSVEAPLDLSSSLPKKKSTTPKYFSSLTRATSNSKIWNYLIDNGRNMLRTAFSKLKHETSSKNFEAKVKSKKTQTKGLDDSYVQDILKKD